MVDFGVGFYKLTSHDKFIMMLEFWNERYASEEYVYGKEPNIFFKSWVDRMPPGRILLPGEGEGRNAAYAAGRHWDVLAFDQSSKAREKALRLANEHGVNIDYRLGSVFDIQLNNSMFDMIALVFFHLHSGMRKKYHEYLLSHLKPGGIIVVESFAKEQLNRDSGGPRDPDLLYALDELYDDFNGMEVLFSAQDDVMLREGRFHQGMAQLVRFVGKKSMV